MRIIRRPEIDINLLKKSCLFNKRDKEKIIKFIECFKKNRYVYKYDDKDIVNIYPQNSEDPENYDICLVCEEFNYTRMEDFYFDISEEIHTYKNRFWDMIEIYKPIRNNRFFKKSSKKIKKK